MKLNKYWIDEALKLLLILAFVFGVLMFAYLFTELLTDSENFIKNNSSLLAAFFILLSASIASTSMMKSIESSKALQEKSIAANKELKDLDIYNERKGQILFIIHICNEVKNQYSDAVNFSILNGNNPTIVPMLKYDQVKKAIPGILTLWKKLFVDNYFIYLNENTYKNFDNITNKLYILEEFISSVDRISDSDESMLKHRDIKMDIASLLHSLNHQKIKYKI